MFFFNDTATTEIYTLSLHDALPILMKAAISTVCGKIFSKRAPLSPNAYSTLVRRCYENEFARHTDLFVSTSTANLERPDRKSTRLNSSHANISYAVFCLKKK